MVYEDVHWIDPSTREQLDMLVDRVRNLPILLVITFRPEFDPPWTGQSHVIFMALNRLGRSEGAALVERIAGNEALPPEIVREIVERTDGVPLFVEEVTKAILEGGNGGLASHSLRGAVSAGDAPSLAHGATRPARARDARNGASGGGHWARVCL